jgi:hypothetical protein
VNDHSRINKDVDKVGKKTLRSESCELSDIPSLSFTYVQVLTITVFVVWAYFSKRPNTPTCINSMDPVTISRLSIKVYSLPSSSAALYRR